MSRTIVAPIVGVIVLLLKATLGIEIPEELQFQIIDACVTVSAIGAVVYGIVKDHKKKPVE